MVRAEVTPEEIVDFWFPDGPGPDPEKHTELWMWRMRGGSHDAIVERYSEVTQRAADGGFDHWEETPIGRLALIIICDQFPRSVWAGEPRAYSLDPKALKLCLDGLENGHFDALENVWYKTAFKIPLEHCECPEHLANLDRAINIAEKLAGEAPENLKPIYQFAAGQPGRHREVIARFGRHSHRNDILGRESTPEEREYIDHGVFPHNSRLGGEG